MKNFARLVIIIAALLLLGDTVARSQTGAGGSGPWTLSGTIILPKSAAVDWIRITGDATGPRIGSTAGNDILFDPDNDAAAEASISNTGVGTFDSIATADKEASDEGNYLAIFDDDAAGGTAFDGTANNFTIGDIDESATDNWCSFDGTSKVFCFPTASENTGIMGISSGAYQDVDTLAELNTLLASTQIREAYTHATDCPTTYATACDAAGEAGNTCADLDDEKYWYCDGTAWTQIGGAGGFTSFYIDGDNNSPQTITDGNEALFVGGVGIVTTAAATDQVTIATASSEQGFLASGALTCGASTNGKMQVHTTALQYCDNSATPTLRYAAYANSAGYAMLIYDEAVTSAAMSLSTDFGEWSTGLTPGAITIDNGVIDDANMATDDFGSFSCGAGADDCLLDSSVGDAYLTRDASGNLDADAELYTHTKCMTLESPATGDDWLWFRVDTAGAGSTWTVTGVDCLSTGTTPSVTLTINEAGATGTVTNAIEAGLVCDSAGDTEASGLDDATIDNTDWIRIDPTAVSGTVVQTSVCITYTVAD